MQFSWDAFLARYRALARSLAENLCGRSAEAEDIVQEAALALLAALRREPERFESTAHARNYFLRTVRNLASDRRTSAANSTARLEEDTAPESSETDAELEAVRSRQVLLGTLLRELPAEDRELVARRFLRRQTLAEISRETRLPVSTLHSRERALLTRLRRAAEQAQRGLR